MEIATDVLRQVYCEDGNYVTVRPWPEGPDCVCLMTDGEDNHVYFGKVNIAMNPEFAKQLGAALIACADEILSA